MYQFLSNEISTHQQLLELATAVGPSQPAPNLFLAAVNYVAMKSPNEPMAKFYPNLGGRFAASELMFQTFVEFCENFETEIRMLLATRMVQTNEVQRCALLLPAVSLISKKSAGAKLALIDVGASGGLNLLMDQVSIRYSDGSNAGPTDSPLQIRCESSGVKLPAFNDVVRISSRLGIDLNPIDFRNADERDWSFALIWPDQDQRLQRLKTAVELLSTNQLSIRKGNAIQLLTEVASEVPEDQIICIMHSFTVNQFSKDDREIFDRTLAKISEKRDLWRISLEWIETEFPELAITFYESGQRKIFEKLAECHGHGEWIRWINQGSILE